MARFSLEEKKAILSLFDKCDVALLDVSELEGVNHINKVIIDGKKYDIPSKDLAFQLRMCTGALDLIREKGSILSLDRNERNFVIRNHPAWIMLRDTFELNGELGPELSGVINTKQKRPYEIWCQDFCDSLGDKRFYPKKNMKSLMVDYVGFATLFKMNKDRVRLKIKDDLYTSFVPDVSPLYRGFFEAMRVMSEENPELTVSLNKFGYPEVYYNKNGKSIRIDVSTEEGLNRLLLLSPSSLEGSSEPLKKPKQKKKRPTKGKKKK